MPSASADPGEVRVEYVTSADGTRIGYLSQGTGPGVVLVQGAGADASAFADLAAALAGSFTVHRADRRGRGLSPRPYDAGHDVARDVEDVDAVLAATGARLLFGLSSGAAITLEAARTLDRVTRAAVFEPPLPHDGPSAAGVRRIDDEIERGDLGAALVDSLLVSGTAPRALRLLPRPVATLLGRAVLAVDARLPGTRTRLRDLVPGVRYDFAVVVAMNRRVDNLGSLDKPVLLLSGSRSPAYLRRCSRSLADVLPEARFVELAGLGHDGPWSSGRGGRPQDVADELRPFFEERT